MTEAVKLIQMAVVLGELQTAHAIQAEALGFVEDARLRAALPPR